ncbi:ribulose-phosphate 3-epimerase [Streptobacillus moniliformis]|uniref:Ribulose-phosphate 3-epimerase n=1 Tax=Streptobacillus moniliformis (strain ATCC 14647 / DSM 12112 / NCTC 10651 / 9901) TaxID=519441 RepID=D1AVA0_STRM9|nr:ribulose-phosphate 3-epimerase [Streptobacillus moniliformis]ACZ01660.1 ribulose-phosphate 3-epimerase [Streptobacillus moniliformis DSM 12112]AVL43341.1 ribulose-phosphate 3-epimerase [Streptobacillus moniliformis]SQA13162.1 Ribulose-phosphate 3-epimerase [Streptobacillus moniliformis]
MNKEIIIAPSLLAADFSNLKEEVIKIGETKAKWLHLDIMDGNFVPNISFGADVIKAIRPYSQLHFDAHLMVEKPEWYIETVAKAGVNSITIHAEATKHLHRALQLIKSHGVKAGVSINPATDIGFLDNIIEELDLILVMTVNPGFGGQKFIDAMCQKVKRIREKFPHIDIQVDGGINDKTCLLVKEAGANILVAGSYVFSGDYNEKVNSLL